MVELAIAGNDSFEVSRMELDRSGPSYSVDTLEALAVAGTPEGRLVWILSVEALEGLPRWHRPERLLELARVAVVPRRGHPRPTDTWLASNFPGREDRFVFLDGPDLGHSASGIRARVAAGRSIRYLLPDAVAAYIRDHRLYAGDGWPPT
jgi:nicotinate-nucleotide adenylyltransferase